MNGKTARYLQQLPSRVCVYCGNLATTRDHVVADTILARPLPVNAITVPSCHGCNGKFSKDEQYFTAVLGMIGRTPAIEKRIEEGADIYRTLERSSKLDDRLISSVLYLHELGAPPILQIEEDRLAPLFRKIAFGLFLATYRPKDVPPLGAFKPLRLGEAGLLQRMNITRGFHQRRWKSLQKDVFDYSFFKSKLAPHIGERYCLMRFYGPTLFAAVQCSGPMQNASG
jgi:hypothetical protein